MKKLVWAGLVLSLVGCSDAPRDWNESDQDMLEFSLDTFMQEFDGKYDLPINALALEANDFIGKDMCYELKSGKYACYESAKYGAAFMGEYTKSQLSKFKELEDGFAQLEVGKENINAIEEKNRNANRLEFRVRSVRGASTSITGQPLDRIEVVNLNDVPLSKDNISFSFNRGNCRSGQKYVRQYLEAKDAIWGYGETLKVDYICESLIEVQMDVAGNDKYTFTFH
ncbi:hypothetical protein [Photobacterium leiognathi]|uniref:hypothetical protein n=1 Tax=Photobacterium leiognathi TaxID=553611 RepID=UPI0029827982|nr:hypothetical protein [Photobacterium leiognathi]